MADDTTLAKPALQLVPFPQQAAMPAFEAIAVPSPETTERYGLFPMAGGDVVITLALFNTVVALLESGDQTTRRGLAAQLRASYYAIFVRRP